MAPEGWKGESNDIQIDMYALGLILFELAALRFPYKLPADLSDIEKVREMHLLSPPESLRRLRPDLPPRFNDIVMKLLEKRPRDRYADWATVGQALEDSSDVNAKESSTVVSIASAIAQGHEKATEARLKQEKERAEESLRSKLDQFQRDELVKRIDAMIEEVNRVSEAAKIRVTSRACGGRDITVPYGGSGTIEFFQIRPPLKLRSGVVRYGGVVSDGSGCGFNLLLMRRPQEEEYGDWIVCRVSTNPLSGRTHRHCREFGLGVGDVREIETADRAMHVFQVKFARDVEKALEQFLVNLAPGGA